MAKKKTKKVKGSFLWGLVTGMIGLSLIQSISKANVKVTVEKTKE